MPELEKNQQPTQKERYAVIARDLQAVARRLMISGMHVHVGIEDPEDIIADIDQALAAAVG